MLEKERDNANKLQARLDSLEQNKQATETGKSAEQQSQLQTNLEHLQAKCEKQKQKLASLEEAHKNLGA